MVGTTVQHFEILELIGRGAMGTVYKARDTRLDILRALKFLQPALSDMHFAQAHLLREARTQAKLLHPNVAALLELEVTDEWTFLVLEYVDGPTLDVYLAESKPPLKERFNLILQVACALDAAHSRSILHRDIKPKNVLIAPDGTAKVTDFGLAKALGQTTLTMSGETKGTAPYMAPEAFRGETTGEAADVWSFGVLAYEALEDKLPFEGDSFEAVAYQIVNQPHPPLSNKVQETLPGMSEFLDACLNKDERKRLADGSEALLALTGIAAEAGLNSSVPALSIPRIHRRKRAKVLRKRAAIALAGIVILAGLLLSITLRGTRYVDTELGWRAPKGNNDVAWDKKGERVALIMEMGASGLFIWNTVKEDAEPEPIPLNTRVEFEYVSWAPNDSTLALAGPDGLYLYDITGKELRQISDQHVEDPSWSGNSRWIVYSNPEDRTALERIGPFQPDSNQLHEFVPQRLEITGLDFLGESIQLHDPTYILDDTRIAFRIERIAEHLGVYTIPAEGGEAQPLMRGEMCPYSLDWDANKGELVFYSSAEKPDIYRVKVKKGGRATGRKRALNVGVKLADFDYNTETGRIVALTALVKQEIWRIPIRADGDSIVRVIKEFEPTTCPSLSKDGSELFYVAVSSETGVQLRVRMLSSGIDEDLVDDYPRIKNENSPAPSPDNRYIVFQAFSDSTDNLWLYDRDRRDPKQLTFDSAVESDPTWAADGLSIYYVWSPIESESPMQIRQLFLNRVDGGLEAGSDSTITNSGGWLKCPLPSADGQYLLYEDNSTLYVIGPEGKSKKLIPGKFPALSPSRQDVYYYRGNRLFRITDWPDLFNKPPIEQMVTPLPQNAKIIYNGPPLTVGHYAVYAALITEDVGYLKVLSPDR